MRKRLTFGLALFLLSSLATPLLVAQQQNLWFTVYYPTWLQMPLGEQDYGLPPWEVDWTGITHIVHFDNENIQQTAPYLSYVVNNTTGRNDSIDLFYNGIANPSGAHIPWADSLLTIAHRHGIKVLLSLVAVNAANLNYVASDSVRTEVFASAVVGFLMRHGYDGIELDWEGWESPITSPANVNRLVRRLRAKLDTMTPRGLFLVSPSSDHAALYWPSQDHMIDQFNLQMYDLSYAWYPAINDNASWYISPLHRGTIPSGFEGEAYDTRGPLQWVQAGHDRKKMGMLMPSFACVYQGADGLFQNFSYLVFDLARRDVLELTKYGGTYSWDDQRKVPFISGTATTSVPFIPLNSGQKFRASFESEQSITEKINWARSSGIGGVGFYDLKGDVQTNQPFGMRNPLHKAAATAIGNGASSADEPPAVVGSFELRQNYPNPFNPVTRISYVLTSASPVTLRVFDLLGREVSILVDEPQQAGLYSVDFDAAHVPSGVYVYVLSAQGTVQARKMTVLK